MQGTRGTRLKTCCGSPSMSERARSLFDHFIFFYERGTRITGTEGSRTQRRIESNRVTLHSTPHTSASPLLTGRDRLPTPPARPSHTVRKEQRRALLARVERREPRRQRLPAPDGAVLLHAPHARAHRRCSPAVAPMHHGGDEEAGCLHLGRQRRARRLQGHRLARGSPWSVHPRPDGRIRPPATLGPLVRDFRIGH